MPRYFFNISDGTDFHDRQGEDLPDLEAAKDAALQIVGEMLPSIGAALWEHQAFTVAIKDETGELVAALTVTALLS